MGAVEVDDSDADAADDADATSGVLDRVFDLLAGGTRRFSLACSLVFFPSSFPASAAAADRVLRALPGTGGGLGRACLPFGVARNSGGILRSRISTADGGSARLMSSSRGTRVVYMTLRVNIHRERSTAIMCTHRLARARHRD